MTQWILKRFDDLGVLELYEYLALRNEVFIVEQNCPYQDMDGLDPSALHLLGIEENTVVACARLFPPGIVYPEASIGRVITKKSHRGKQLGHELMTRALAHCHELFPESAVKIGAQQYLERFYQSHGFVTVSDTYLEDGIPHIKMLRGADNS